MLKFAGKMSFNHKSSGLWDDLKLCPKGMTPLDSYEESPQNPSINASVGGEKQFGITQEGACFFYDEANGIMPDFFVYSKKDLLEYLECCEYEYKHPSLEYCNKKFLPSMYSAKYNHVQNLNDLVKLNFYINVRINSTGSNDAQYLMPCDNASRNAYYDMLKILISNSTQGNRPAYTKCSFFKFKNEKTQSTYFFMKPEFIKEYTSIELGNILKSKFEDVTIDSDNINSIPSQFAFIFRRQLGSENIELDDVLACCDNLDEKQKKKVKEAIEKVLAVQEAFWKKEIDEANASIAQYCDSDINELPLSDVLQNSNFGVRQKIFFGAPGTGKSFQMGLIAKKLEPCKKMVYKAEVREEKFLNSSFVNDAKSVFDLDETFKKELFDINSIEELKDLENKIKNDKVDRNGAKKLVVLNDYCSFANRSLLAVRRIERITFHPNYSYAQFVGTYKPIQNEKNKDQIEYKYIPGPFLRVYKRACKYPKKDFLLIIEEINRANVAAVFGDVFQLLDRKDGVSEYPIAASEDVKRYLKDNGITDCNELRIPSNMYIWATMNSADQGVFPMDTAFKRRWEFEYIGVNEGAGKLVDEQNQPIKIPIPYINNQKQIAYKSVEWNKLRVAINEKLLKEYRINEDKLMGPFFINLEVLKGANATDDSKKAFVKSFKSKVLMYLYEDVAKMNPGKLFSGCGEHPLYSTVCEKFDEIGEGIFGFEKTVLDEMLKQPE